MVYNKEKFIPFYSDVYLSQEYLKDTHLVYVTNCSTS